MSYSRALHAGMVVILACGATPAPAQSSCRPADATSARMLQWVKNIGTGTSAYHSDVRTHTKIPFVSAGQVTYVTSQSVCNKALNPYNTESQMQHAGTGAAIPPSGSLYVVKAGTVYVVMDPAKTAGEYGFYVTLDSKYKVLWAGIG